MQDVYPTVACDRGVDHPFRLGCLRDIRRTDEAFSTFILDQALRLLGAVCHLVHQHHLRATQVSDKVKEALQRVSTLRDRLDQTVQQGRRFEQQIHDIAQEQARIRENMGKLAQNSELYNRYVRKLDQQETEIDKIRKDSEALKKTEAQQRSELNDYLMGLDIS